jgi:hypothetical protein
MLNDIPIIGVSLDKRPASFARSLAFAFLAACFTTAVAAEREPPRSTHWSLQPRTTPKIPRFEDAESSRWLRTPVDAFVLARLKQAALSPAPEADRATLTRRLYFDLVGLPPMPEEIDAFLNDPAPDAYERLVERLLASPRYGERWAQHWLDVVRFAETEGFEYDRHRVGAWRYRDYVIRSLNADKPYDRFVLEQLAGDEIAPEDQECLIAVGFHRLGPVRRNAGNQDVASSRNEVLTDQTNAIGSVFLGLTIGCARCHDHMFDPIKQTDYYRLQAFLAASVEHDVPLASTEEQARWKAKFEEAEREIKEIKVQIEEASGDELAQLNAQLKMAQLQLPPPLPSLCSVKNDAAKRTPIHLLKRGDPEQPGEPLGPRPPGVLVSIPTPELPSDTSNPRTALSMWLTRPDHPLTARVIVNRVWQWHFGQGLVATTNDFGLNGDEPSHPELLDYLANEFVAGGWRLKSLHRLILLSSTYRQASRSSQESMTRQKDAENRLLWKFPRRRLSAEELRDAMLSVSGVLNERRGGESVMVPVDADLVDLLYDPAQWRVAESRGEHHRRSVYLLSKRNLRLPLLEVFDQPDRQTSCARREASTHAPQALELLNGRLANELAAALAERLARECGNDPHRQIERAFLLATGRIPSPSQRRLALAFLADQPLREFALSILNLNSFLYVN